MIGSPAFVDECFELTVREEVAHGLFAQWSVFDAVGYGKDAVEGTWIFEKFGQAGHHPQTLKTFVQFKLHDYNIDVSVCLGVASFVANVMLLIRKKLSAFN